MKKMLVKICMFGFFIICFDDVYAQNASLNADSLKEILSVQKEDTNKVKTLTRLAWTVFQKYEYENTIQSAKQALALSEKLHFKAGMAESYNAISVSYRYLSNYPEALNNQYKRLAIFEELKDSAAIAYSLQYIGDLFKLQENNGEALNSYFSSLNLLNKLGDLEGVGVTYFLISQVYYQQRNYDKALKMDSAALAYFKQGNENDEWTIAWINSSIGNIYEQYGIPDTALKAYLRAMDLFKKNGREDAAVNMYVNLGSVYTSLRNFKLANNYLNNALSIGREVNDKEMIKQAYEKLAVLDSAQGNYKSAYEHHKKFTLYKDSILNKEGIAKATAYQQQYQYEKKDAAVKIEQAKKDAEAKRSKSQQYFIIISLAIIVLAAVIIAFIQYRNSEQKQLANVALQQQKEKVEITLSELKSTQTQLIQAEKLASLGELTAGIAHEIQNPLNFVNNFSEVSVELINDLKSRAKDGKKEEVIAIANDLAGNLQKIVTHGRRADSIVKGMLQHSRRNTGEKQFTNINALADEYLRLSYQAMRSKDKSFQALIKTDFDETIEKINIVPQDMGRVLLNLFQNAFYAVQKKKEQLNGSYDPMVSVSTKKQNGRVEVVVIDNGTGIPQNVVKKIFQPFFTTKPTGEGTGLGLSLSYDIVTKGHGGELIVTSKEGEGATFTVQLPLDK